MQLFKNYHDRTRDTLILTGILTALAVLMAAAALIFKEHMERPADERPYPSNVAREDCVLCGDANNYRNADMLAMIVLNGDSFSQFNAGLKQYCTAGSILEEGCDLLRLRDEGLSPGELQHKYAPYDINGTYRLHPDWEFHSSLFSKAGDRHGTSGAIHSYEHNRLVYGRLDISPDGRADAKFWSSKLCRECYDKVYPATRTANCFLYDYLTGTVYPLTDGPDSFDIRQYSVDLIYRTAENIVFVIRQEDAPDAA